eukprot:767568-Hanusia_phi.AAC.2
MKRKKEGSGGMKIAGGLARARAGDERSDHVLCHGTSSAGMWVGGQIMGVKMGGESTGGLERGSWARGRRIW